ncbi:MAG: HEPN-associated N-terminal domain-containing protein [Acetobacteraceae bacterium]
MQGKYNSDFVCAACFSDEAIQSFVECHAESTDCDFCGAVSEEPIAAPLPDVADFIFAGIGRLYDDPTNAGLTYETAEGGWQGETYTTYEIFDEVDLDFPGSGGDRLREAIESASPTDLWCDAEPYRLNEDQRLQFSWDDFCRVIKHKRRYFFHQNRRDDDDEIYSPNEVLKIIFTYAQDVGALITIPRGRHFYRARYQPRGQNFASAKMLGPPPEEKAIQTNRMSPPGIVMTYVADDENTALAETANGPGVFAVGEFVTERDALILDLTNLPPIPSLFAEVPDTMEYDPRPRRAFLHSISRDISRPIARDDRLHVEYVPTQVVTEYVRSVMMVDDRRVDGIRYKSSRYKAGTAVVLFADGSNVVLEEAERPEFYHLSRDRWLTLRRVVRRRITKTDIVRWTTRPRERLI